MAPVEVVEKMTDTDDGSVGRGDDIRELLRRYDAVVDAGDMAAWPDLFTRSEPVYQVITRENYERGMPLSLVLDDSREKLDDRVIMVRDVWTGNFEPYWQRHLTAIMSAESAPDGVLVRSNIVVYRTGTDGVSALFLVGEGVDRVMREDGALRFKERRVILDTHVLPYSIVYPI